jgi:hypothetical protein
MQGRANQVEHMAAIAKVHDIAPYAEALRVHVRRIIESAAFKGSRRSQEFLQYITDRALDGHFDDLKERTLGVELFGRAPSYDTGEDAIVRVTACDVRKRLAQFHAEIGFASEFRVDLPPGSYIPDLRKAAVEPLPVALVEIPSPADVSPGLTVVPKADAGKRLMLPRIFRHVPRLAAAALLGIGLCAGLWIGNQHYSVFALSSPKRVMPWSALIQPNRQTHIIFCDPEIVTIQKILNFTVSLSDYANRHYWPDPGLLTPEMRRIMQAVSFRGTNVAAVDAEMALKIAELPVAGASHQIDTHTARGVRLVDFKTEDSFILFGSPRSNPWVELFRDQLDFIFEFNDIKRSEFVRNKRPLSGEQSMYVPTAEGWGTGQAYAIVAFIGNPNQSGDVMVLAGSNAEATAAAGKLATNLDLLSQTLKSHGIDPSGPARHFEMLLRVSTMAGSPNTFDVIACHALPTKTT